MSQLPNELARCRTEVREAIRADSQTLQKSAKPNPFPRTRKNTPPFDRASHTLPGYFAHRAEMFFSCYGDQNSGGTTFTGTHPGGEIFASAARIDMDCRGERGGLEFVSVNHRASSSNDNELDDLDIPGLNPPSASNDDDWDWRWRCMDGTTGSGGQAFTSESGYEKMNQWMMNQLMPPGSNMMACQRK